MCVVCVYLQGNPQTMGVKTLLESKDILDVSHCLTYLQRAVQGFKFGFRLGLGLGV